VALIFVYAIEFYGYHGVPEAERTVGHRYMVDVDLDVDEQASLTDNVEDTVDYGAIGQLVVQIGTTERVRTVERLAHLIADTILAHYASVNSVTVSVFKPHPPMPVIASQAGVTLTLERSTSA
jgi:7,8-dihydroneopterin aldolase/epimerase/oxygenase